MINQFLCCEAMAITTRSQDIFHNVTKCLNKMNLTWKSCVGICKDSAPCMTGCIKGFVFLAGKKPKSYLYKHLVVQNLKIA